MAQRVGIVGAHANRMIEIGERTLELAGSQKQIAAIDPGMRVFGVTRDGALQIGHGEIVSAGFLICQSTRRQGEAHIGSRRRGRIDHHGAGGDGDLRIGRVTARRFRA